MLSSNQNPFRQDEENPFANDTNKRSNPKNFIFIGVLIMLAILAFYFLSNGDVSLQPNAKEVDKLKEAIEAEKNSKDIEVFDTLQGHLPYYLWAFAEGERAAVWVFSFKNDGKSYLTIFNPVTKTISYKAAYPDADCDIKRVNVSACLADDVGLLKNKLWISVDKKDELRAFDVHTGALIYDNNKLAEKFGSKADGIIKLRSYGFDRIEFYPYSEKIGLRSARELDNKFSGSIKRFMVNNKPGKSNVYVTDAKIGSVEGDIYFAWDYDDCESYKPSSHNSRHINSVKKLPATLINPIKVAENGEAAIFLHDREFGNNVARYVEAIDVNGNSLWKDSTDVFQLINSSNSFPIKYNPLYAGNIAVFFNPSEMTTCGIEFTTGKVLWNLDNAAIHQLIQSK